jgi:hypothetical protein
MCRKGRKKSPQLRKTRHRKEHTGSTSIFFQAVMRSALQEEPALDLATALLFEADSLGQQAFLEGAAQEPDYVLAAVRKAPDKALRKR